MDRRKRRGTSRIDGDAGTGDAEQVRDPPGGCAGSIAGGRVQITPLFQTKFCIAARPTTDKDADFAIEQFCRNNSSRFQRLPGRLQQQAMRRVHHHHFARGKAKEAGVKLINHGQKTGRRRALAEKIQGARRG